VSSSLPFTSIFIGTPPPHGPTTRRRRARCPFVAPPPGERPPRSRRRLFVALMALMATGDRVCRERVYFSRERTLCYQHALLYPYRGSDADSTNQRRPVRVRKKFIDTVTYCVVPVISIIVLVTKITDYQDARNDKCSPAITHREVYPPGRRKRNGYNRMPVLER